MTQIRAILDRLTAIIVATNVNQPRDKQLLPTGYRRPIEQEPVQGSHRRFECLITGGRPSPSHPTFGAGVAFVDFDVAVRVSYARLGGDAGGGDRLSVNSMAGADAILIADALCNVLHYAGDATTGIREISYISGGSTLEIDDPQRVVWATRVKVESSLPWPL